MATRAITAARARPITPWITLIGIVVVGAAAAALAAMVVLMIDPPTTAAARQGLARLVQGDPLLHADELRGLALIAYAAVMHPLAVLGIMLGIERLAGPRHREPKDYVLAVMVQSLFLFVTYALYYASGKLLQPSRPLIQIDPGIGVTGLLLETLPMYLVAILVGDFFRYWFHRAQHRFAILWRFHAVHHSPRDLDVLHNIVHPVEEIGNLVFILVPAAYLIGVDARELYFLTAFFAVQAHIHHMNVPIHYGPFGHLLVDPRYHFLHHSRDPAHFDSNFAAFSPLFDRLFGTYCAPEPGPLPQTGLPDGKPTRLSHYLLGRWPGGEPAPSGQRR